MFYPRKMIMFHLRLYNLLIFRVHFKKVDSKSEGTFDDYGKWIQLDFRYKPIGARVVRPDRKFLDTP
jgi:hypothetical protein